MIKIRRTLISVSDKTGIVDFAKGLASLGIEIIASGGTAKILKENNIPVIEISDYTGFLEMLDGRVKTLHPKIHAGILALRDNPKHMDTLKDHNIGLIDMVVVNLYPFESTVAKKSTTLEEAIENIDIGGPSMLRSAAKNYKNVAVVSEPEDYNKILDELKQNNISLSTDTLKALGIKAFKITSNYDRAIFDYLKKKTSSHLLFPDDLILSFKKLQDLRYGENPHQKAAFYVTDQNCGFANLKQINGKELSFNNLLDLEAAYKILIEFNNPACVIIKHTNPSGVAVAKTLKAAFINAWKADELSAFGGIIGLNKDVDLNTAKAILKIGFIECIIAPKFLYKTLELLKQRKNLRLIELDFDLKTKDDLDFKKIEGGLLIQEKDIDTIDLDKIKTVTDKKPTKEQLKSLIFAWQVVKHVRSNAIVVARDTKTIGIGAGQTSRVDSVKIALEKSCKSDLRGAVLASDAFFPKEDGVMFAIKKGICAIIQPGGSIQDEAIIRLCDKFGVTMIFAGIRHFKH